MFPLSKPAMQRLLEGLAKVSLWGGGIPQVPGYETTEGLGETKTGHGYCEPCHALNAEFRVMNGASIP